MHAEFYVLSGTSIIESVVLRSGVLLLLGVEMELLSDQLAAGESGNKCSPYSPFCFLYSVGASSVWTQFENRGPWCLLCGPWGSIVGMVTG